MTNREIFDVFTGAGMTAEGACAVMGNFMAESSMVPNIAQRGMTKLTDAQYTAAADNGLIDFAHDQVGYGLAQWTYHTRKANLLAYARAQGVSVGDPAMQCRFCLKELQADYHTIWHDLCQSHDLFQLTQLVCTQYERPAVNNVGTRYEYAQEFLKEMTEKPTIKPKDPIQATFPPDPKIWGIQNIMRADGYYGEPDGHKSQEFFRKLREYVDDMEGC